VSREVTPGDAVVVTVGSIQAGMTENIIPSSADMKINVRTVRPDTRLRVLAAIRRIIKAECEASNATREPLIEPTSRFPFTTNDVNVTTDLERAFAAHFTDMHSAQADRLQGSEDFPILATSIGAPYCYWVFGGVDQAAWDAAASSGRLADDIPINHSPHYAPVIQPTLGAGVDALVLAALNFMTAA
jgi:metal-dependent amidase/aminoacylase/carboxypeptidase family protein